MSKRVLISIIASLVFAATAFTWSSTLTSPASAKGKSISAAPAVANVTQVFSNTAPITLNAEGPATPYGSTITVAMNGSIVPTAGSVKVTFNGFTHSYPSDLGIVLVAPDGSALDIQDNVGLMEPPPGEPTPSPLPVTYSLSDAGDQMIPEFGLITAGTYRPAVYVDPLPFPSPGPANFEIPEIIGEETFSSVF